jgi:hypothetical protein
MLLTARNAAVVVERERGQRQVIKATARPSNPGSFSAVCEAKARLANLEWAGRVASPGQRSGERQTSRRRHYLGEAQPEEVLGDLRRFFVA